MAKKKNRAQPAQKSYFFEKGYKDVARVIKSNWSDSFSVVSKEISRVKGLFYSNVFVAILTTLCDIVVFSIMTTIILLINTLFSVVFLTLFVILALIIYVAYTLVYVADGIFCLFRHIGSHCPTCQSKFLLPAYRCPSCGALHTRLRPGTYGILYRKCNCGNKIPTTFFNGRQRLKAVCAVCETNLKDGGNHVEISIPVVGGPSAGKTCFISMAITQIEKVALKHKLNFAYSSTQNDDYLGIKGQMEKGRLPQKTNDDRLTYYQFYLTPQGDKTKTLVSLCDVAGEVYQKNSEIGKQIGYKHANAFLMLIDPLSVSGFRSEVSESIDLKKYGASSRSMDEILNALVTTLENMQCIDAKSVVKTDVAVVFTKCDIPGLDEKIGGSAVRKYMQENHVSSRFEAQNKLCEKFLKDYNEENFLNSVISKFKSVQFFTCSALGHVANGTSFNPDNVEEPVLWLVDKVSSSINLKDKWGKKI